MGGQEESWRVGDEKRAGGLEGGRQGRMAASQRMKAGQVHFNSSLLAACKVCLRNEGYCHNMYFLQCLGRGTF